MFVVVVVVVVAFVVEVELARKVDQSFIPFDRYMMVCFLDEDTKELSVSSFYFIFEHSMTI